MQRRWSYFGLLPNVFFDVFPDQIGFFQPDEKRALLGDDIRRAIGPADADARLARRFSRFDGLPWSAQMMHFDFETYLPEVILTKVDRMSMAHSIESRVPLLDNHVVEFAAAIPAGLKIKNGRKKHILKEAASSLLPAGILNRRKQGFAVPVGGWFRGDLREFFSDVLLSRRARQRGYFNGRFIDRMIHEHVSGRRDHTLRLWALVVFELWHRQYMDPGATAAELPRLWNSFNTVCANTGVTRVITGSTGRRMLTFNEHAHLARDQVTYR